MSAAAPSHDFEGSTGTVDAEFTFRGKDVHRSQIRVTELVLGERVGWHVLDNYMSFIEDQTEWMDSRIVFEISTTGDGTQIRFSHLGLFLATSASTSARTRGASSSTTACTT
jgi:hypothetical protein